MKNPKFFTVEEAEKLVPFLETTFERIRRNNQHYLWLQGEIAILKLIVECGAADNNPDTIALNEKTIKFKCIAREVKRDLASIEEKGCILRDIDKAIVDLFSIQNGSVVFLCWKRGEDSIKYWHSIHDGMAGRQLLLRSSQQK